MTKMAAAALQPAEIHSAPLRPREVRPAPRHDSTEKHLHAALALANNLVELARVRTRSLALEDLGDIELPPALPATADDQAQIRAIAPLYLASQLEEVNLLKAVETLSSLAISGGIPVDLGDATALIASFWSGRNERFHENERRAFFAR